MGSLSLFTVTFIGLWYDLSYLSLQLIGRSRDKPKGKNRWRGVLSSSMSVPGQEELVWYSSEAKKQGERSQNQCRRACGLTQSRSLLGQAVFLAVGQHASVMQDELEWPQPFLIERLQETPTLDCLLTFQLLAEKIQASLAEIMDDPCHLSFKLLGSE